MKNIESKKSEVEIKQPQPAQEREMRTLTDCEVLSVAGGPEVDVESGT
ncbi:hypothetical protein [Undibacterium pigrum]|uniref:Uncharacterized protein n=1 Tax=Undibacterium pigrum TaxID=401470 RepID=A0A318JX83_9BURK|nr:hypothetical protein [Undibacterium pigrum]PXX45325.1 hypothetical protein DFR42_102553 [Undibacterium pigrum]